MTRALTLAALLAAAGCGGPEENRYVGWGSICGTCATVSAPEPGTCVPGPEPGICVPALSDAFPCGYVGWNPPFPTSEIRCTGTTAAGWTCYTTEAIDVSRIGVVCEKLP